jgi:hypothetical protein
MTGKIEHCSLTVSAAVTEVSRPQHNNQVCLDFLSNFDLW